MPKVFLEYKISVLDLEKYKQWMNEKRLKYRQLELYEGTDQPGLVVELWEDKDYEAFALWKEQRLDPKDPEWGELHQWAASGKIHIWHFRELLP